MKSLKFRDYLVPEILSGRKDVTWRLFDKKNIKAGDKIELINWNTGERFGRADVLDVREKKLGQVGDEDFEGHEKFESREEMVETYKKYYGDKANEDTIVKIINFDLREK